jgi:hypothetical protein
VPATQIEEADFSPVLRAREEAASPVDVADRQRAMLATLDLLSQSLEPPADPAAEGGAA